MAYVAELPGDVLVALRESLGFFSARAFADSIDYDHSTLSRLENVTWETPPHSGGPRVERRHIETLERKGWISKGDAWWHRFEVALTWQHIALRYGASVLKDLGSSLTLLEPVWEGHATVVARAGAEAVMQENQETSDPLSEAEAEAVSEEVCEVVVVVLRGIGLLDVRATDGRIAPDTETTRSLNDLMTGTHAADSPYLNTLLLALKLAQAEARLLRSGG